MKVPKEVKEQLERTPAFLFKLAGAAIILAADLTKAAADFTREIRQMEVEDD